MMLAKHDEIALVVSDLKMPEMDGVELLSRIRVRWPEVAVMMITGVDNVQIAVHCLSLGALDYLNKPFKSEEVLARVRHAMDTQRLMVENRVFQEMLREKVTRQAKRLETLFLASVQSLAAALEAKDPYTRGHSERVSKYASIIAAEFKLDGEQMRQIELGGHVHDVGKIGVREEVLNKPGKLTDEEYAHVMTHPMIGWHILESLLEEAPLALNIVRSHHERFDGTGMPDGLVGGAIPFEARITAIADSLDAMTSHRPYRVEGVPFDDAVREIVRCSSTQFDPNVVVGFLNAVRSGRLVLLPQPPSSSQ
jgi:putative two-component system response regulator